LELTRLLAENHSIIGNLSSETLEIFWVHNHLA